MKSGNRKTSKEEENMEIDRKRQKVVLPTRKEKQTINK